MTKQEKNDVIEVLKGKFSQYNNFYITDTESLTVAQVGKLRNHCFNKQVEMKVAKNTLIKKALESIDAEKYAGVYDSLHKVTALLFSDNPKEPAVIISGFRKENNNDRPVLKAAFINGDVFVGDNQLKSLTQIKTKNELIGEVIGLLQSPIQRVLGALQNKDKAAEVTGETAPEVPTVAGNESKEAPVTDKSPEEGAITSASGQKADDSVGGNNNTPETIVPDESAQPEEGKSNPPEAEAPEQKENESGEGKTQ